MIGRDFTHIGTEKGVYSKYGDGYGYPYRGPIKNVFLDGNTVAVMDADKGIYIQRLGGTAYYICPAPALTLDTLIKVPSDDSDDDEDKVKVETETLETNYVDVNPTDMCIIPMTENVAIADRSNVIKITNKYEWFIDRTIGGMGSGLGMLARVSSIDAFQIGAQNFFVVSENGNQRIYLKDVNISCLLVVLVHWWDNSGILRVLPRMLCHTHSNLQLHLPRRKEGQWMLWLHLS